MTELVKRLDGARDCDGGSLLDSTALLWANHMGDGGAHSSKAVPWILPGRMVKIRQGEDGAFAQHGWHDARLRADCAFVDMEGIRPTSRLPRRLHCLPASKGTFDDPNGPFADAGPGRWW